MLAFLFGALACVPVFIISSKLEVCVCVCVCACTREYVSTCLALKPSTKGVDVSSFVCCVCGVQEKV